MSIKASLAVCASLKIFASFELIWAIEERESKSDRAIVMGSIPVGEDSTYGMGLEVDAMYQILSKIGQRPCGCPSDFVNSTDSMLIFTDSLQKQGCLVYSCLTGQVLVNSVISNTFVIC